MGSVKGTNGFRSSSEDCLGLRLCDGGGAFQDGRPPYRSANPH